MEGDPPTAGAKLRRRTRSDTCRRPPIWLPWQMPSLCIVEGASSPPTSTTTYSMPMPCCSSRITANILRSVFATRHAACTCVYMCIYVPVNFIIPPVYLQYLRSRQSRAPFQAEQLVAPLAAGVQSGVQDIDRLPYFQSNRNSLTNYRWVESKEINKMATRRPRQKRGPAEPSDLFTMWLAETSSRDYWHWHRRQQPVA